MHRYMAIAGSMVAVSLALLLPSAPASAITAKQKMATCGFGADHPEGGGPSSSARSASSLLADVCPARTIRAVLALERPAPGEQMDEPEPESARLKRLVVALPQWWLPSYLQETKHLTIMKTGLYTAVPWTIAVPVSIVIGIVSDRVWPRTRFWPAAGAVWSSFAAARQ